MSKIHLNICFIMIFLFGISCINKVEVRDDLKKELSSLSQNTVLGVYDNKIGKLHVYNLPVYKDSLIPAGNTADIFLSLVGIEEGSIEDGKSKMIINNKEVNLQEAFRNNDTNFFKTLLISKMDESYLKDKMDTLHYGKTFADKKDLYNNLLITTDEQVGLIKKIFFNQLPFQDRTIKIIKGLFNTTTYKDNDWYWKVSKKTLPNNTINYWVVGWVDNKKNVAFFAFHTSLPNPKNPLNETKTIVHFTEQLVSKVLQ